MGDGCKHQMEQRCYSRPPEMAEAPVCTRSEKCEGCLFSATSLVANSEVVAEMMKPMLTDTDAIARISDNLRQQDKGLWEKIKDWIQGLVEKLKNAYKDLTPGSAIAQQTRNIVTQSEEILNAWVEAATDAVVNYNLQDGQKNNTPGGVQYSLRGVNQGGIEVYETSDEVKALPYQLRQKKFLDIMANEYRGRTAKFVRDGSTYYATFETGDVNKNIYGDKRSDTKGWKAKINVGADGNIFELVENATYAGSKQESGKESSAHRNVDHWDYFVKNVQIDGTVYDLLANVRKRSDGEFVYSIQLRQNKKIKASPPLDSRLRASNGVPNASTSSIPSDSQNVNPEDTLLSSRNVRDAEYLKLAEDPEDNRIELEDMVFSEAERKGYLYRRNTFAEHSAVKGTPWQMFVKGLDANLDGYGEYAYVATDKGATPIEEIMPTLRSLAEEYYGSEIDDDEINPPDIIMSAGVWDDIGFVQYIWDNYFEGEADRTGEIPAIVTEDGMMVMDIDEKRVKSAAAVEYDNNGNIIPLSQRFDSEAENIRFSQRSAEQLERENEKLRRDLEFNSIAKSFADEIERWDSEGRDQGQSFILGSTGEVLQGLGAIESDIYMNGDKITTIMQEHPEITLQEIKQIPQILNDPVLILKSRNVGRTGQNTRMTLFGSVKGTNGQPVMAVFDLRPTENHFVINDMQKVTSAYTKTTDAVRFVQSSYVMYADKKKPLRCFGQ